MPDTILPVKIEIRPPDAGEISKAMSEIERRVEESGRKIGQAKSSAVDTKGIKAETNAASKAYTDAYKTIATKIKAIQFKPTLVKGTQKSIVSYLEAFRKTRDKIL